MTWRPIYKQSSLPYNEGERFLVRRNDCVCNTEEPNIIKCLKTRPCVVDLIVLNELSFAEIRPESGLIYKGISCSKEGIILKFKAWKMITPDPRSRQDIFVCRCKNVCILHRTNDHSKDDNTKLECCHCKELVLRCSKECINSMRGR